MNGGFRFPYTNLQHRRTGVLLVVLLLVCLRGHAFGQALPSGFVEDVIIGNLNQPTAFAMLPDGRMLITEKAGLVRVLKNGALLQTPFIDLRNSVNDYWDHGLLGIAADINFATNGYVYLLHTYENDPVDYSGPKTGRLVRVTASGDVASPSSLVTLLGTSTGSSCKNFPAGTDCLPSDNPSHSVGLVRSAPDGTLWVTQGDGASFNVVDDDALRSQDLDSLAGKLMHITVTGQGISTNPFWNGSASANRSKVWAYGFRNPYRFVLHPSTGTPVVGDVGWGSWEEVDAPLTTAQSMNHGWPCYEGPVQTDYSTKAVCQALYAQGPTGTRAPLVTYPHNMGSSAVTAGTFYTGQSFPPQYQGVFIYGDYGVGFLRYLRIGADGSMTSPLNGLAAGRGGPVFIDTDGTSLLYVAINTGDIRRIRYTTPTSGVSYLSDRTWTSMSNGIGPVERDQSNGDAAPVDGRVILLRGQPYAKGLGTSAPSDVRFALGGSCSTFNATIGVDDEVGSAGSVVFQVWRDGVKGYDSGTITSATAATPISVSVSSVNELRLVVTDAGSGSPSDHADWADARVTCTATADTTPPTVVSTTPANNATKVPVGGAVTAAFSETMSASSLTTATFTLVPQGTTTPVAATVSFNAATATATLTPSSPLAAITSYTATVKGGTAGAKDLSGNALAADVTWTFTTGNAPITSYLSDLAWVSATNGYGPVERDHSNGEDLANDGGPITLNGVVYAKGLGVHALSTIVYALNSACTQFSAVVGVDDEVGSNGSIRFQLQTDGTQRFDSGIMTGTMPGQPVTLDVTGVSQLTLVVNDAGDGTNYDHGDWANAKVVCSAAGGVPTPTITQPPSTLTYKVGDVINFSGSATDPEDGTIPAASLSWTILLHHCPGGTCHIHPFLNTTGASGSFTIPDHGDDNYFEISLTATDSSGNTATKSVTIQPQTAKLTLNTSPQGLNVFYTGISYTTPVTITSVVGSTHTIFAPSPQSGQNFASWSDGGAQQHNIVTPATNVAFTATFTTAGADTTPPTITSVTPAAGATNVAVNTNVTATFSEAMLASSLTTSTVTLVPQGSSTPVAATVAYDASTFKVTLTPAASLSVARLYTATVKGGTSGAKDLAGNALVSDVTWTFTTTSSSSTSYLSDLTWTSATNGYGPVELDHSNGEDLANDGGTITLNGVTYAKGLGVHATSEIHYALGAACSTFTAVVGVDDEVGNNGTVVFQVWTDGVKRFDSGTMTGAMPGQNVSLGITGANDLELLLTDNADGSNYDHGDWANAQVACGTDTTPPTVTAITPASGASGVPVTTTVTATFSEDMTAASITASTFTLIVQSTSAAVPAAVVYNTSTRVATLTPSASLAANTVYTARVKSGSTGVKDAAGNPLATDRVWSFTTAAGADTTPPTVTSVTPAAGATNVAVNTAVTATFSEAMLASSLTTSTVTLVPQGSSTPVAATVAYDASTFKVTLTPAASLTVATLYTATVKSGTSGAKDLAGNALVSDVTWTFTTASNSTVSYLSDLTWTSATNGYGPVELDHSNGEDLANDGTTITLNGVTYLKGLGTHATSTIHYALGGSCSVLSAVVGVDDEVGPNGSVTFQVWTDGVKRYDSGVMTGVMPGANVTVDVTGATDLALIVTDAGDGSNYDHADWANAQVTCGAAGGGDTTPPTVTAISPASGATGVPVTTTVTATFSENMTATTITASTFTLIVQSTSAAVSAAVVYNASTRVATLTPSASLAAGTVYTARVMSGASGVKDAAGNPLASDQVWSFTTAAADTTPPTVTAVTPASGATGVARSVKPTATFSEPMLATTITAANAFITLQGSSTPVAATVTYSASTQKVTISPSSNLGATKTYVVTIRGGTSGVKDANGNPMAADKTWSFTTR